MSARTIYALVGMALFLAGCGAQTGGHSVDSTAGNGAQSVQASESVTDCPLREAGYSAESPLIDLLINHRTRDIIAQELQPGQLERIPFFADVKPPTGASIITVEQFAGILGLGADAVDRIVAGVSQIDPTEEEKDARCARYDSEAPALSPGEGRIRILVFEKVTGYFHETATAASRQAFKALADRHGWSIATTELGGAINPQTLSMFDVVIWNQVSGDVLTLTQRAALEDFVNNGGGFIGIHGSGGDFIYFWDWYVGELIGAQFIGHTMEPQFQDALVTVWDTEHPIAEGLPQSWTMQDEWYAFSDDPRASGATVIAGLDGSTFTPFVAQGQARDEHAEHPIAWAKCVGKGKMFYSAIGHREDAFERPEYLTMLKNAVEWTAEHNCP